MKTTLTLVSPTTTNDNNTDAAVVRAARTAENDFRVAFWRTYAVWADAASDSDLEKLQAALENYGAADVQSLVTVIRQVLQDEAAKRQFPASFLAQLKEANWPGAEANGS
jgi:hypothetical protein